MGRKKIRLPAYTSLVGEGTVIKGALSFSGGLHVAGRIVGDVTGEPGRSGKRSALTLGMSGVIEGNLDVPYVVIEGAVNGDVRATKCAILAAGARIMGAVYYQALELDDGAEIDGKLVHIASGEDPGTIGQPVASLDVSTIEAAAASTASSGDGADRMRASCDGA